jgi:hypothetical protein
MIDSICRRILWKRINLFLVVGTISSTPLNSLSAASSPPPSERLSDFSSFFRVAPHAVPGNFVPGGVRIAEAGAILRKST